jgi:IS4 transposase
MTPPAGQRWRRSKPKEEGWYWWRGRKDGLNMPFIIEIITMHDSVRNRLVACFTNGRREWLDDLHGEWQGPLTPQEAS